jgi:hypothetical protein
MCNIIRLFILTTAFVLSNVSMAHDANLATFQIRQVGEQQWMYEVMTPLYNLDKSLRASEKNIPTADVNNLKYKQKIIAHIKQGFNVKATSLKSTASAVQLTLGEGRVKLDDHLSVLIFKINGMPKTIKQLDFSLKTMSENVVYNNIFRIIKGDKNERYLLNVDNNFSGRVTDFFTEDKIIPSSKKARKEATKSTVKK